MDCTEPQPDPCKNAFPCSSLNMISCPLTLFGKDGSTSSILCIHGNKIINKVPRELEFAVKILVVISINNKILISIQIFYHFILPENIAIVKSGRRLAKYSLNII